jgi:hypothetical protein
MIQGTRRITRTIKSDLRYFADLLLCDHAFACVAHVFRFRPPNTCEFAGFAGAGKPVLQSDHASDRRLNLWDCFFCVLVLLR